MANQSLSARAATALAVLVPLLLAGCAAPGGHGQRHSQDAATGAYSGMGGPQAGMDMQSMCETHKKMMAGKSPAERQSMMEEQKKSMSPGMRKQAEEMMANCK